MFVSFKNVTKAYRVGDTELHALKGVDFDVAAGEFVVIVGPSGSGKTTLLNLLGGMDNATAGEIIVDGKAVHDMNERALTKYRRDIVGFVFQFYNLMPNLTALENIELAVEICKDPLDPIEVLETVGLTDRSANFPSQLSGGEQQRVSIARSVAKNSSLLLCDEPTGALDYETGKKILKLLHTICKEQGKTVILVTHNGALRDMADRVITMKNGLVAEIAENKSPQSIDEIEW
ncbi:MAG: ABC transporter ATP-binding protein [Firmicutes bacterium]|nr:ABC transporter ATP-binding protein [Bacillota bacterium]